MQLLDGFKAANPFEYHKKCLQVELDPHQVNLDKPLRFELIN